MEQKNTSFSPVNFIIFLMLLVASLTLNVFAASTSMYSKKNIQNINEVLDKLKKTSTIPVHFPNEIYAKKFQEKLFASYSSQDPKQSWCIFVGSTVECNGRHYCNIGYQCAEQNAKIDPFYYIASFKKAAKQRIMLADGTYAYFTPAHAQADYHEAMIEWQEGSILYTLSWKLPIHNGKQIMLTMANSAKHPGAN